MPKLVKSDIEKLIELFRGHKCLYDPSCPEHRDAQLIYNAWRSIEDEMGNDKLNGSDWKKKWRNQRDLYIKKRRELRNKKSGQAAKKAMKWQFFETMNCLDKYTEETSTDTNVPAAVDDENESAGELSGMEQSQNTYVRSETQSRSASPSISTGQPCRSTEQSSTSSEKTGKQGTGLKRPLCSSGISRDNDAVSNMSKSLNQLIEVHKRHTEDWFKDTNKKTSEELFF